MKCPACNVAIEANSVFCPKCGERLDGDDERVGARITADGEADSPSEETAASRLREQMTPSTNRDEDDDREIELWEGGFSSKAMFTWWIGAGVLTVVLGIVAVVFITIVPLVIACVVGIALVWLYPLCLLLYRRFALHYKLTNQRFLHEHGIMSRVTDRIEVIDIDDVSFKQTLIDRMVGVGSIRIESGDRTHPVLVLHGIYDVERVYDLIDGARREERVRRGVHIAHAGRGDGL